MFQWIIDCLLVHPQAHAGQEDMLIVHRQPETGQQISVNSPLTWSGVTVDVCLVEGAETMAKVDQPEGQVTRRDASAASHGRVSVQSSAVTSSPASM